eukprot:gnl/TRDRNA2_/TRDRNA2_88274_c0_seq1.p3 gnl/TRDRNA2_/TRDRNA2_88274_c0~~gnl/TRDRNA2_/TRDRNA2_88274_c0_seq1.p3  ORF type:complete len:135 (-),score=27.87 gnl/TRDRNA2_/TRDRNA2_88274_c0_seq1:282-686(-)
MPAKPKATAKKGGRSDSAAIPADLVAAPADAAVNELCGHLKDDVLQQMWGKGWQGPELEIFAAESFVERMPPTGIAAVAARNIFIKVRVGVESYGDDNIDEFALIHVAVAEGAVPELKGVKLRHPPELDPACFE